jgi:hypothetical protein
MSTLSHAQRRLRDRVLFRTPTLWRYWPYLSVLRPHPSGQGQELGVLYDARRASGRYGFSATVFVTNLFLLPPTEEALFALPRHVYDTAEEMIDAGWTAD